MADATCGPKLEACFGDYECRADLREGIRATLYPASQAHFEGSQTMCRKTPMFQELYECIDARDGLRAWRRSRCLAPDELLPPQCATLLTDLPAACPGASALTPAGAASYACPAECATAIVTTYTYCMTSFSAGMVSECQQQDI